MTLHWWMHWFWITGTVLACLFLGLHARSIPDQEFALADELSVSQPQQTSLQHDEATQFETASILEELSTVEGASVWYGDTEIPEPSGDQSPDFTSDSGRRAPGTSSLSLHMEQIPEVTPESFLASREDILGTAPSSNAEQYDAPHTMTYEQTTGQILTRSTSEDVVSSTSNNSQETKLKVLLATPAVLLDSLPHDPSSHILPGITDMQTEVKQNAGQRLMPRDLRNVSDPNPGAIPASPSLRLNARAGKAVGYFPPEPVATTPAYKTFESFPFPVSSDAPTSGYRGYHTGPDSRVTWISTVSTNITKLKDVTSRDETKQNETTTSLPDTTLLAENDTEQSDVVEEATLEVTNETTVGTPVSKSRVAMSGRRGLDAAGITGIALGAVVVVGLAGAVSFVLYRRRFLNKPQTLNDKCSNPDSSGYIDDSTLRENSEEMYSLDNDSFLNSLEAMTIQNYWTDSVKHTKL